MRKFRRTTLLTVAFISVLLGLGLARKIQLQPSIWLVSFIPFIFLILKKKNFIALIFCIVLGLFAGLWRGTEYMDKLTQLKSLSGQNISLNVTATSDSIYSANSQLEFTASSAKITTKNEQLAGSFKISGFGEPMIYRGDKVLVSGKLYPMRGSNQARIYYAQIQKIGDDQNWINRFTRKMTAGMQSALPEPNASFGLGLLIGQRNNLPSDLTNQLVMVGLVHIVAVSGYNLTILVRAISRLNLSSKYQRLIASLGLICLFVLMCGFSASIVRAAIVSGLSLVAWFYGRKFLPVQLILLTAAVTALINPFYIWGDLGWYLSFLAFFGVMVIAPQISKRLFRKTPKILASVVLETLCAEMMTLPLIMMSFSQLSLIGILANALVAPIIPLAMLFGAVAATGGMWLPTIAGWLAWPANTVLTYILDIVRGLSQIPGIFVHRSISLQSMLCLYIFVIAFVIVLHKERLSPKNDKITDKKY